MCTHVYVSSSIYFSKPKTSDPLHTLFFHGKTPLRTILADVFQGESPLHQSQLDHYQKNDLYTSLQDTYLFILGFKHDKCHYHMMYDVIQLTWPVAGTLLVIYGCVYAFIVAFSDVALYYT